MIAPARRATPTEHAIRAAHRHIRLAGGYVACECGEDWDDHRVHVAEKLAAAGITVISPAAMGGDR